MSESLADLKAKRDALNDLIVAVEDGIREAAYDAEMQRQLVTINEARMEAGKPPLSMSQFASGCWAQEKQV